jgi:NAD(P)H-hydrate epimerase
MLPIPVLTPAQAAEWDHRTAELGLAPVALMESAGRGVVALLTARFPRALRQGTLVACGPGNNGGDGWVIARALHGLGLPVWVVVVPGTPSPLNRLEAALARQAGVREVAADGPWPNGGLVVDAVLGTGAKGAPRPPLPALLARLGDLALPVVAVDGPTGLDLEDGVSHGALAATLTVTFGGYRRGHLLARDEVGDLAVLEIGFVAPDPAWPALFAAEWASRALPPLPARSHKGSRGRIVVVGGDAGMIGAARLAARAAFAAGAGLVHVLAPGPSVAAISQAEPDVQTAECPLGEPLPARARELLGRADAVVVGPGLGRAAGRGAWVEALAGLTAAPLVLDADGLMAFAGDPGALARLGARGGLVLTPHAGEFRALFPEWASRLGVDPWGLADQAARAIGAVLLLKGVPTVIGDGRGRDGGAEPRPAPLTVAAGNPGLATGGSGDTLSGIIATWLAQGIDARLAAALGAQALGEAADLAARRSATRSIRPADVTQALADVWRHWELIREGPPAVVAPILHELPAPRSG